MEQAMIKQYTVLVEFLSRALGPDYEISFHDLTAPGKPIVAIAHGNISGRTTGPVSANPPLRTFLEHQQGAGDYVAHYHAATRDNRILRCSTMYVKDEEGNVIGLLEINFDHSRYQSVSKSILQLCHPNYFVESEFLPFITTAQSPAGYRPEREPEPAAFSGDLEDFVRTVSSGIAQSHDLDRLTRRERQQVVEALDSRGVFKVKGAVKQVAQLLGCSPSSIYRCLSSLPQTGGQRP